MTSTTRLILRRGERTQVPLKELLTTLLKENSLLLHAYRSNQATLIKSYQLALKSLIQMGEIKLENQVITHLYGLHQVQQRAEAERIEADRIEAERIEAERIEAERIEAERIEAERIEAERIEAERIEAERFDAELRRAYRARDPESIEHQRLRLNDVLSQHLVHRQNELTELSFDDLETRYKIWRRSLKTMDDHSPQIFRLERLRLFADPERSLSLKYPLEISDCELKGELKIILNLSEVEEQGQGEQDQGEQDQGEHVGAVPVKILRVMGDALHLTLNCAQETAIDLESLYLNRFEIASDKGCMPSSLHGRDLHIGRTLLHSLVKKDGHKNAWRLDLKIEAYENLTTGLKLSNELSELSLDNIYLNTCSIHSSRITQLTFHKINTLFRKGTKIPLGYRVAALTELGSGVNPQLTFEETEISSLEINDANLTRLEFNRSSVEGAKFAKLALFEWSLLSSYFAFRGEGKQSAHYLNQLHLENSAIVNSSKTKKAVKLELEYLPFDDLEGIYERPVTDPQILMKRSFLGHLEILLPQRLKRIELSDCCGLSSLLLSPGYRVANIALDELCLSNFTSLQTIKHYNQVKLSSFSIVKTEAFEVSLREDDGKIKSALCHQRYLTWIEEMSPQSVMSIGDAENAENHQEDLGQDDTDESELIEEDDLDLTGGEVTEGTEGEGAEIVIQSPSDPLVDYITTLKLHQLYLQRRGSLRLDDVNLGELTYFRVMVPFTFLKLATVIPSKTLDPHTDSGIAGLRLRTLDTTMKHLTVMFYPHDQKTIDSVDKSHHEKLISRAVEGIDNSDISELSIFTHEQAILQQTLTFNRAKLNAVTVAPSERYDLSQAAIDDTPNVSLSINRSKVESLELHHGIYRELKVTHSEFIGETRFHALKAQSINLRGSTATQLSLSELNARYLETLKLGSAHSEHESAAQTSLCLDEFKADELELSMSYFHRLDLRRAAIKAIKMSRVQLAMLRMWRAPSRLVKLLRYLPERQSYQEFQITQTQFAGIESRLFEERYLPLPKGATPYELNALHREGEPRSDLFVLMGEREHEVYMRTLDEQLRQQDSELSSTDADSTTETHDSEGLLHEIHYPVILFNDEDLASSKGMKAKIYTDQKLADSLIERVKQEYLPTEIGQWELDRSSINNDAFSAEEERLDIAHYNELKTRLSSKLSRLLLRPRVEVLKIKESSIVKNRCFSWLEYQRLEVFHSELHNEVFAESIIHQNAQLERSDIEGTRTFAGARVKGETLLHLCVFRSEAHESFRGSEFMGPLSLNMITIQRGLSLREAILHESLNLTDFTLEPRPNKAILPIVNNITVDLSDTRFERALSIATPHLNEPKDSVSLTVNLERSIITRVLDLSRLGKSDLTVSLFDEFGQIEEEISVPFEPLVVFDKLSYNELLVHPLGLGEMTYRMEPYRSIPAPISSSSTVKKTRGLKHWYQNRVTRGRLTTQDHLRNARFYKHLYSAAQSKGRDREWRYYHRRFIKHLNRAYTSLNTLEQPISRVKGALLSFLQWYELDIYSVTGRFSVAKLAVKAMGLSLLMLCVHLIVLGETSVTKELLFTSTIQSWFGPVFGILGISLHDMEEVHGFATQMIYGVHCMFNLFLLAPILKHGFSISAPESIELQIERHLEGPEGLRHPSVLRAIGERRSISEYLLSASVLSPLICATYGMFACTLTICGLVAVMIGSKFYAQDRDNTFFASLSLGLLFGLLGGLSFYGAANHLINQVSTIFNGITYPLYLLSTMVSATLTIYAVYFVGSIFIRPHEVDD